MSEPGSVAMNCPYCGQPLYAGRVEFSSANILLKDRKGVPDSVIPGESKQRIFSWCNMCWITVIIERRIPNGELEDSEEEE